MRTSPAAVVFGVVAKDRDPLVVCWIVRWTIGGEDERIMDS